MLSLISLQEARYQTFVDDSIHDIGLQHTIEEVSDAVLLWLKDPWRLYVPARDSSGAIVRDSNGDPVPETDEHGKPIVRGVVKRAVKIEVASQFRFREGEGDNRVEAHEGYGYVLSKTATSLLAPLRRPTVA